MEFITLPDIVLMAIYNAFVYKMVSGIVKIKVSSVHLSKLYYFKEN